MARGGPLLILRGGVAGQAATTDPAGGGGMDCELRLGASLWWVASAKGAPLSGWVRFDGRREPVSGRVRVAGGRVHVELELPAGGRLQLTTLGPGPSRWFALSDLRGTLEQSGEERRVELRWDIRRDLPRLLRGGG